MYGAKAKKHYPDGKSIRLNVADFCHRTEPGPKLSALRWGATGFLYQRIRGHLVAARPMARSFFEFWA